MRVADLEQQQADMVANLDEMTRRCRSLYQVAKAEFAAEVALGRRRNGHARSQKPPRPAAPPVGFPPGRSPTSSARSPAASASERLGQPPLRWPHPQGHRHVRRPRCSGQAVTDGTLRFSNGGLGGISIWLKGSGASYYYAHLDSRVGGLTAGSYVTRGTIIGYVGNTGNAYGGADHLHFQIHPGHGSAVNPYPTLAGAC